LNGDILPNEQYSYVPPKKKRNREKDVEEDGKEDEDEDEEDDRVDVGNITLKVLGAIAALLDNFFESKTIPFTTERLDHFDRSCANMEMHFHILWELKQILSGETDLNLPMSRNLHAIRHTPRMGRMFGGMDKFSASSWESAHRVFTTGVWAKTSKRHSTMNKEMTKGCLMQSHASVQEFLCVISSGSIGPFIKKRGPFTAPENILYSKVQNTADFSLYVNMNNQLAVQGDKFILHSYLSLERFTTLVKDAIGESQWDALCAPNNNKAPSLKLLQAIKIEGNKESKFGTAIIYATAKYVSGECRYDYVEVCTEDTGGVIHYQPAQVLAILQLKSKISGRINLFAIVQFMKRKASQLSLSDIHDWEFAYNSRRQKEFVVQVVRIETISPAFVIPVFSNLSVLPHQPAFEVNFWLLPRKFCDRSEWDEVVTTELMKPIEKLIGDYGDGDRQNMSDIDTDDSDSKVENEEDSHEEDSGDSDEEEGR
jgi:hypothetical protein